MAAAKKRLRKPGRAERTERSQVIHTELDQAAALINSVSFFGQAEMCGA